MKKIQYVRLDMPQHRFSTKCYLLWTLFLTCVFLGLGAWCSQIFDMHVQELEVKNNAWQLAQIVCSVPQSALCHSDNVMVSVSVQCADSHNQVKRFSCALDSTMGVQQIADLVGNNWIKLMHEQGKEFSRYTGGQIYLLEPHHAIILTDQHGDYGFTLA